MFISNKAVLKQTFSIVYIKKKLNALERAKINANRERLGLPPLRNGNQDCFSYICAALRQINQKVIKNLIDPPSLDLNNDDTSFAHILLKKAMLGSSTIQYNVIMRLLLMMATSIFCIFLYVLLKYQSGLSSVLSASLAGAFQAFLGVGLHLNQNVQIVSFLCIPTLFTSKGRLLVFLYASAIVIEQNMTNFHTNFGQLTDTYICSIRFAKEMSQRKYKAITRPIEEIIDAFKGKIEEIKRDARSHREKMLIIKSIWYKAMQPIIASAKWIGSAFRNCSNFFQGKMSACNIWIEDIEMKCWDKLNWFIRWMCYLVKAAGLLCSLIPLAEVILCFIIDVVKLIFNSLGMIIDLNFNALINLYNAECIFTYKYNYGVIMSKTLKEIQRDVAEEISNAFSPFFKFKQLSSGATVFLSLYIFIGAIKYRINYFRKLQKDNYYLDPYLDQIDDRRKEMGLSRVMPIGSIERLRFIPVYSPMLTPIEIAKIGINVIMVQVVGFFFLAIFIILDIALYYVLVLLREVSTLIMNADIKRKEKNMMKVKYASKMSVFSRIYHEILSIIDIPAHLSGTNESIGLYTCMPNPNQPSWFHIQIIVVLMFLITYSIFFQPYILRTRHLLCDYYYPKQNKIRIVWLYDKILKTRESFSSCLIRKVTMSAREINQRTEKSFIYRVYASFPFIERIAKNLGLTSSIACSMCSLIVEKKQMNKLMINCRNHECPANYCRDCFRDTGNLCIYCDRPIDYGRHSEYSDEIDSTATEPELKHVTVPLKLQQQLASKMITDARKHNYDYQFENPNANNTDTAVSGQSGYETSKRNVEAEKQKYIKSVNTDPNVILANRSKNNPELYSDEISDNNYDEPKHDETNYSEPKHNETNYSEQRYITTASSPASQAIDSDDESDVPLLKLPNKKPRRRKKKNNQDDLNRNNNNKGEKEKKLRKNRTKRKSPVKSYLPKHGYKREMQDFKDSYINTGKHHGSSSENEIEDLLVELTLLNNLKKLNNATEKSYMSRFK